jgi:hypothetical protein
MEYIAPRKMTVASVSGRSVEFEKGKPTYAPPQMHAELIAVGIVPAEDIPEVVVDGPVEPTIPAEREAALFAAFEKISLRGRREEFTAVGVPHSAVLTKELGWSGLSGKERDAAWAKFTLAKAGA